MPVFGRPDDDDRCTHLSWKGMYVLSQSELPHSNDGLYWCHSTQQCTGPDGKGVDHYECNETRKCYKSL